jgi:hypothetical protein
MYVCMYVCMYVVVVCASAFCKVDLECTHMYIHAVCTHVHTAYMQVCMCIHAYLVSTSWVCKGDIWKVHISIYMRCVRMYTPHICIRELVYECIYTHMHDAYIHTCMLTWSVLYIVGVQRGSGMRDAYTPHICMCVYT